MEENLNIFGKNQGEIGSLDKNLVLRTKGRVYIRYGRKYIELLDDEGNINVKIPSPLKRVDSIDQIIETGFYLLDGDLYACYEGDIFQITGTDGQYISYTNEQNLTQEQISMAQQNIGLTFNSINNAITHVKKGIVFIGDKIYYIEDGNSREIFGLNHPLKEINSAGLDEIPPNNNSVLLWRNGDWIYEEVLLKKDLPDNDITLNTPIKDINEAKLDQPQNFKIFDGDSIVKAIVAEQDENGIIRWKYEDVVPFSVFKKCCENMKEQIAYIKDLLYNNSATQYGGTDNWGQDRAPMYIDYMAGARSKDDSIYVDNVTLQEYAGDGNWCQCIKVNNAVLYYKALTENPGPGTRTAYFTHKTTDTILARGHHAGNRVLPEWVVTVIQVPKDSDIPVNKKLVTGNAEERISKDAQSVNINLIYNVDWRVISDSKWCTISPTQGTSTGIDNQTAVVVATVEANTTSFQRTAVLTFSNPFGEVSATKVQIIQDPGDKLYLKNSELGFSSNIGTINASSRELPYLNNIYNFDVIWSSSDTSIASVDNHGNVTENVITGQCDIQIYFAGNDDYNPKTTSYRLTIDKTIILPSDEFSYSKSSITIKKKTASLPTLTNTNGLTISYTSSNPEVAIIDNTGKVTVLDSGTTTISATPTDEVYRNNTASYKLIVNLGKDLTDNEFKFIEVDGLPELVNTKNVNPINYFSSDISVATIDDDGDITIIGSGTTIITAEFQGNSEYNAKTVEYTLVVPEQEESQLDKFLKVYNEGFFSEEPITNSSANYSFLNTATNFFNTQYQTINWRNILEDSEIGVEITEIDKDTCFGWYLAYVLLSLYPLKETGGNKVTNDGILKVAFDNYSEVNQQSSYSNINLKEYLKKYGSALFASIIFVTLIRDKREEFKSVKNTTYSTKFIQAYSYKNPETTNANFYLETWPDGTGFFAKPPINGSNNVIYNRDIQIHDSTGQLRGIEGRGMTAYYDIDASVDYLLQIYNAASGGNLSSAKPYAYQTFNRTSRTGTRVVNSIKTAPDWYRVRPVDYLSTEHSGETTYPYGAYINGNYYYDNSTRDGVLGSTSYPSGHTGNAWHTAFIYCLEAPNANIEELFNRAFIYSESRVVVGAHWQYCVDMGRIAASCVFPILCGNNEFISRIDTDLTKN